MIIVVVKFFLVVRYLLVSVTDVFFCAGRVVCCLFLGIFCVLCCVRWGVFLFLCVWRWFSLYLV